MLGHILRVSLVAAALTPAVLYAQHPMPMSDKAKPAATKGTAAKKIADAMSAAPADISKHATIMDWPEKEGGEPKQLRAGDNGWVCFPSAPSEFGAASGGDPMCLDKQWQAWGNAWMSKTQPK